jgi:hypothetical protein
LQQGVAYQMHVIMLATRSMVFTHHSSYDGFFRERIHPNDLVQLSIIQVHKINILSHFVSVSIS